MEPTPDTRKPTDEQSATHGSATPRALFNPRTEPLKFPPVLDETPAEILAEQVLASQRLEGFEPAHSVAELAEKIRALREGRSEG